MVSIAFHIPASGPPKRVSGWSREDHQTALFLATRLLEGVGLASTSHIERSGCIKCFRRPLRRAEILLLADVGIATAAKKALA